LGRCLSGCLVDRSSENRRAKNTAQGVRAKHLPISFARWCKF